MSDFEATSSRGQTPAPITTAAIAKLRAIGGQTPAFAQADGLVDAFAEVFARMAVAKPVRAQQPVTNTDSAPSVSDERSIESRPSDSSNQDLANAAAQTGADPRQNIVDAEDNNTDVSLRDDQAEVASDVGVVEQADAEVIDISAVEVLQTENAIDEIEVPDVIVQAVVEDDEDGHRRRDRRDSTAAEPVENTENGRWGGDRKNPNGERIQRPAEEIRAEEPLKFEPTNQGDQGESSRRVRGRHNHAGEQSNQPSAATVGRARTTPSPNAVSNAAVSGESNASQSGPAEATSTRPATRSVESAVTNLQSVAQSAVRSNATNGAPTQSQSGARGSTQAIEPRTSARDAAQSRPETSPAKSNTAETISRVKLIQRVSKAFQHLGPDGGSVRLRLAPAELGSIRVEMRIHQRKVQARVIAESEAAGAALREHLPELRQRLESQGMQVERLEIETGESESELGSHTGRQGRRDSSSNPDPQWSDGRGTSSEALGHASTSIAQPVSQSVSQLEDLTSNIGVDVRL